MIFLNKDDNKYGVKDNNSSKYSFHFNPQDNHYKENVNDKNLEYHNVRKRIYKPDYRKSSGIVSVLGIAFMLTILAVFVVFMIVR